MTEPHREGDGATPGPSRCGASGKSATPADASLVADIAFDLSQWKGAMEWAAAEQARDRASSVVAWHTQISRPPSSETPPTDSGLVHESQFGARPLRIAHPPLVVRSQPADGPTSDRLPWNRSARVGVALLCAAGLLVGTAVAVAPQSASAGPGSSSSEPDPDSSELAAAEVLPAAVPAPAAPEPVTPVPAAPDPAAAPAPVVAPAPVAPEVMEEVAASPPRRVSIRKLKIDTPLINLGLLKNGELEVPAAFDLAGWHSNGTAPGDIGPAVIVGHVDSSDGPAIFYRVRELVPGDRITVDRADGSQVIFEVYGKETVAKDKFPTEKVYGETGSPELRLLTCGGRYNKKTKSYTDNVVVFARQVVEPVPA